MKDRIDRARAAANELSDELSSSDWDPYRVIGLVWTGAWLDKYDTEGTHPPSEAEMQAYLWKQRALRGTNWQIADQELDSLIGDAGEGTYFE